MFLDRALVPCLSCSRLSWRRRQWHPTPVLLPGKSHGQRSPMGCSPWGHGVGHDWVTSLSLFIHALEKEMAAHSSVLTWRILGMGEPGGLLSVGSHRAGHNWSDSAAAAAGFPGGSDGKEYTCQCRRGKKHGFGPWVRKIPGEGNGNPPQYSCLGNPMDREAWQAIVHGVAKSQTWPNN